MANIKAVIFFAILINFGFTANSQTLEIPIEELPSESVTPALDSPVAVQGRTLSYSKRVGANLDLGYLLDEPFYNNQFIGLRGMYNWNEIHGIGLRMMNWATGISDYGKQFTQLNFDYAKGPKLGYAISYENRFIYGKVSFAKNMVLPISVLGQFELGQIQYGSKSLPFLSAGIGNNLFFTNYFGITLMVRFMMRQVMDPLSQVIRVSPTAPNPAPTEGDFGTVTRFSTGLDVGAVFLF